VVLGWTCIGWMIALAMALRSAPGPAVQVIHQVTTTGAPPPPYPPWTPAYGASGTPAAQPWLQAHPDRYGTPGAGPVPQAGPSAADGPPGGDAGYRELRGCRHAPHPGSSRRRGSGCASLVRSQTRTKVRSPGSRTRWGLRSPAHFTRQASPGSAGTDLHL
jgi:hypothetical protein